MVWYDRDMKSKLEKIAIFIHWCAHLLGVSSIIVVFPVFFVGSSQQSSLALEIGIPTTLFFSFILFVVVYWGYSAIGGIIRFLLTGKFSLFPWKKHRFEKPVIWTIFISVIYMVFLYASGFY